MKKIIYLFTLCLFLVGCGSGETGDLSSGADNQNDKIKSEPERAEPEKQSEKPEKPKDEKVLIEKGETVVIEDFSEFTLTDTKFGKKIEPPNPSSFYTYYEAKEEGTTYLDIIITVKSLLTSGKSADEFVSVKVMFNDKYEYRTFSTIEKDGGGDFTYTNITSIEPLKNGTLHFLAEVPEEVESGTEPLDVELTINGKEYTYKIR